ncbi:hypothetical protein QRX60_09915 [Amycolatopsis mongoliensis]|uniref:Uncharacterized protein n=1 Tax=Amycolatopsis mongoliensis TaxID=715475 RepID=A0A9Y2NJL7_9PSEU|nr:hypothetical protein [Amycolatopsis sp. 4-36]WIY04139.1 hypothetical protein QRX60_09915 [Amycolatopsis sp. 4-36]
MALGFPSRSLTVDLPVIALTLAAIAHWIRGAPADALIFLAVTLLLLITERPSADDGFELAEPFRVPGFAVVAAGLLVLAFGRDSVPVAVAISAIGLVALFAEWRDPSLPVDRPVPRRAWLWSAVALSWCAWELLSFVYEQAAGGLSVTHPTMSDLVDPLLASRIVQALAITGWLAAGLAMLRAAATARRS